MANNKKKKKIINDITPIDNAFLQPIFGGNKDADPSSPEYNGHFHDDGTEWGHAPKIDLTKHTTGRLILQDSYAVAKSISLPASANSDTGKIWYFSLPSDININKIPYFTFNWMGDATNGSNIIVNTNFQSTVFRVTWQWYVPGYAIFPPAVIYDTQPPVSDPNSNINRNSLTRGRLPNFTVNVLPFQLLTNDSTNGQPNYIKLTGFDQAPNAALVGIQVDVLSTGFENGIQFFNGNFFYISKTLGSSVITFNSL